LGPSVSFFLPCSLELISEINQPFNNVFLSQQISKQYFQSWLIHETNCVAQVVGQLASRQTNSLAIRSSVARMNFLDQRPFGPALYKA
jgi:hypothetical protein